MSDDEPKQEGLADRMRRLLTGGGSEPDSAASQEAERPMRRLPRGAVPAGIVLAVLAVMLLTGVSPFGVVVNGVQTGAVYALVALGIALVYRATGVLNFAQGEFGTVAAFLLLVLVAGGMDLDVSSAPGALAFAGWTLVALAAAGALAVAVNLLIVQQLAEASAVTSLVATAGVALALIQIQILLFGVNAFRYPRYASGGPCLGRVGPDGCERPLTLAGVVITWHAIVVVIVLAAAAVALALLFRTPVGIALLAAAQEPFAAALHGVSVRAMTTLAWATAGVLGGIGGILGSGVFESINPGYMTRVFLIPAFAAALLGGITSMVGAVVGGLLLGATVIFANEVVLSLGLSGVVPGPPDIATFAVLLLVLFLRPRGLLGKEA